MQTAMLLAYLLAIDDGETTFALGRRLASQIVIVLVYLAPSIIAQRYQHPRQPAILMLNMALGWTIVGWVAALIWALNGRRQE
ncbi:superinfection immunity protein [Acidicapsa dinghuensis]|uniref:Superinfection immunity protein n=1 Tax=Acidicapsa dinghuensis TaxID=2218256 RepID=A0ABW1EED5_9BACT|nr:superinfection immunity protein [Acidicapsa dinghuensis]